MHLQHVQFALLARTRNGFGLCCFQAAGRFGQVMATQQRRHSAARFRALVEELRAIAERLGYTVREEKLLREVGYHVRGGGCLVRGTKMIFLDRDASPEAQLDVLVEVLRTEPLDDVFLSPPARELFGRSVPSTSGASTDA